MSDDLSGADDHLEAAYEDANGSALPEHLAYDNDDDYDVADDTVDDGDYNREADYWMWSDHL